MPDDDTGDHSEEALASDLADLEEGETAELDALSRTLESVLGEETADVDIDVEAVWSEIDRRLWGNPAT